MSSVISHYATKVTTTFLTVWSPRWTETPPGYNWEQEREANYFAAELLMPADCLREDAPKHSAARLAQRYKVSIEAMGFRLKNLGLREPS